MSFTTMQHETDGPLAWITPNRRATLNATGGAILAETNRALNSPWRCNGGKSTELLLSDNGPASPDTDEASGLVNRVIDPNLLVDEARAPAIDTAVNGSLAELMAKQPIKQACKTDGMRDALLQALEVDIEVKSTETGEPLRFNEILRARDARVAIRWHKTPLS